MTTKPTPQGISRLLAGAGFERGASMPESLAADGYAVIPNRPDDGIVLVSWWGAGAKHDEMLRRYAEAIESAGYRALKSDHGAYLIITTKAEDQ